MRSSLRLVLGFCSQNIPRRHDCVPRSLTPLICERPLSPKAARIPDLPSEGASFWRLAQASRRLGACEGMADLTGQLPCVQATVASSPIAVAVRSRCRMSSSSWLRLRAAVVWPAEREVTPGLSNA